MMYRTSVDGSRPNFQVLLVLLVLALVALLPASLLAQTSGTSGLTGTVTDQSGAAIAGATVTATNSATDQVRTTTTGATGIYNFSLLSPGTYSVKFEAAGFQPAQVNSVTLNVTETPVLDHSLTVGSQTTLVTVEGDAETLRTESSSLGTVMAPKVVTELPLSTRNYLNLIGLSAGASLDVANASQPGKGSVNLFVNGANNGQNNFQMDGSVVDNYFSTGNGYDQNFYASIPIPNPDAIQEFKIQTSTYDAGFGRNPGANLDVVLKSGTNSFHGSGFEFFRNSALNANDFFTQKAQYGSGLPSKNPVLNQNQFGGTIGGPIKKGKLFFFGSYQETRQKNGLSNLQTTTLPPIPGGNRGTCTTPNWTSLAQCDAATAQFVSALATAMSPNCPGQNSTNFKTNGSVGGIQVACPTQPLTGNNGQYGAAGLYNINPVAINILQLKLANGSYYVPGSTTGPFGVNTFSIPINYAEHQGMLKTDFTLNSKNTITESIVVSTNPTTSPFGTNGTAGKNLPGAPVTYQYWQRANTLKLTTLISNNLVNEARWGYQRFDSKTSNGIPFTNAQVGMNSLSSSWPQMSQIGITSGSVGFQIGGAVLFGLNLAVIQHEFADQLSWTHGKHTFRFGGEFETDYTSINLNGLHLGTQTYPSFSDFLIGRAGCQAGGVGCSATLPGDTNGGAFSSETGISGNTTINANNSNLTSKMRINTVSVFAQDDFKATSRLTLNAGVRWEYFGNAVDLNGQWSNTWPSLLATRPVPGTGCVGPNGQIFGLGAAGTGCSLVGFVAPSNFPGPVPQGVAVNDNPTLMRTRPKLDNFAPRVGFAWQPLGGSNWVIRGGGGFFFDRTNGLVTEEVGHSDPPYAIVLAASPLATETNPFVIPPTIPGPAGTPGWTPRWAYLNASGAAVTANVSGNNTIDPDFTNGLVYEWNVGTQYQFAHSWVLELGYVGSRGIHLAGAGNLTSNTATYQNVPINIALLATPSNPVNCGYDGNPSHCITTTTTNNRELRVPILGMSSDYTAASNTVMSKYNSLQATVRKQLSHGLLLQAAYTYSRSFLTYYVGNSNAIAPGIAPMLDVYLPNVSYRPHRLSLNYSWTIPTFGEHHGIRGQFVNGWTWSGVTTIQNGNPLFISDSRAGSAFVGPGFGPDVLANLCPGVTQSMITGSGSNGSRLNSYFNTVGTVNGVANSPLFCAPPTIPGSSATGYGNYGIGHVFGPGQFNFDMTFQKTFQIRESQSFQFRTELFNVFNHPQFSNPATNVGAGGLGQITTTSVSPRIIQFAVKYLF